MHILLDILIMCYVVMVTCKLRSDSAHKCNMCVPVVPQNTYNVVLLLLLDVIGS